jgi:hypothetical protein
MATSNPSSSTNSLAIINPYSHAATQCRKEQLEFTTHHESLQASTNQVPAVVVVADTMGIQSQQREGAVKKCKKRGTRLLTKHKVPRQQAINAGGVAFNPIVHCGVCKARHFQAIGRKTRIPKRAHHRACPRNLQTRGTSEMTVFVNKEAAQNLAANRARITNTTIQNSQNGSTYRGFFDTQLVQMEV